MRQKLGEILVANGAVSQADVDAALADQRAGEPARLGDLLIALGKLTSEQLARALSAQFGLPYVGLGEIAPAVAALVPAETQRRLRLVPFRAMGKELHVALADPANAPLLEELKKTLNRPIRAHVAPADEVDAILAGAEGFPMATPSRPRAAAAAPAGDPLDELDGLFAGFEADDTPMVATLVDESAPGRMDSGTFELKLDATPSGVMDLLAIPPEAPVRPKAAALPPRPSPGKEATARVPAVKGPPPKDAKPLEVKAAEPKPPPKAGSGAHPALKLKGASGLQPAFKPKEPSGAGKAAEPAKTGALKAAADPASAATPSDPAKSVGARPPKDEAADAPKHAAARPLAPAKEEASKSATARPAAPGKDGAEAAKAGDARPAPGKDDAEAAKAGSARPAGAGKDDAEAAKGATGRLGAHPSAKAAAPAKDEAAEAPAGKDELAGAPRGAGARAAAPGREDADAAKGAGGKDEAPAAPLGEPARAGKETKVARPVSATRPTAPGAPPAAPPQDPAVPELGALPEWLRSGAAPEPADGPKWTGVLDSVPASRLAKALARALLERGVVTEKDILDALGSD